MALIFETDTFILETREKPFVDRSEGGHIRIWPKIKVSLAILYTGARIIALQLNILSGA